MSGRILIADDVPTNRVVLKSKLSTAYYDVILAECGREVIELARCAQPDMILVSIAMSDMDGYTVCSLLKADQQTAHIPVILITSIDSPEERIRGVDVGADDFLTRPINDLALFARVRNLMRMKMMFDELRMRDDTSRELGLHNFIRDDVTDDETPSGVLVAPHQETQGQAWIAALSANLNIFPYLTRYEKEAVGIAGRENPDLFIVEHTLSDGGDGLRLISAIRANPETRKSAIIFVAREGDMVAAAKALDLGATDYVMAPFDLNELVARVRSQIKRKRYSDRLRSNVLDGLKMAVLDPLTGLYNRRYASQHMEGMVLRGNEAKSKVAVLMLDLDNFKSVNDRFGHDAGDSVLREFAIRLRDNVRGVDLVARLGGEEFCVAMPETCEVVAAAAAERVRAAIEEQPFNLPDGLGAISVTVSVGVAVSEVEDRTGEEALRRADFALYASKHHGRNRVSLFEKAA